MLLTLSAVLYVFDVVQVVVIAQGQSKCRLNTVQPLEAARATIANKYGRGITNWHLYEHAGCHKLCSRNSLDASQGRKWHLTVRCQGRVASPQNQNKRLQISKTASDLKMQDEQRPFVTPQPP